MLPVYAALTSVYHCNCDQGMNQLEIQVIDLVANPHHADDEEEKISSSSARKKVLGILIRPPLKVSRTTANNFITCQGTNYKSHPINKLQKA